MEDLYNFWYENRNIWFNATVEDDIKINEYFSKFFDEKIDTEKMLENRKIAVGTVILYDQISRHVARASDKLTLFKKPIDKYHFYKKTNKLAIEYAEKVYGYYRYAFFADEYVFVMLPLRHSYDFNKIKFVMSETWDRIEHERENTEIEKYKRFLKATYERTIKQSENSQVIRFYSKEEENKDDKIDFREIYENYKDILDKFKNPLLAEDILPELILKYKENKKKDFVNKFKESLDSLPKTSYILSISGGVDSMVCSHVLKILNIPFKCVHINYNNRTESEEEEKFVIDWCKLNNIDLYVRKIDEINRPQCMKYNLRDTYESYTRDVRYGTYLKTDKDAYVILGHNQDDCFENILTNISHKSKYENLYGMDLVSPITHLSQTINFARPMLTIPKKEIYEYASVLSIPFLWDSTPKWSQRGKIRDVVRPTLESWDSEMIPGLFQVSKMLKETMELVDIMVDSWKERIIDNTLICKINEIPSNNIFWKKLFEKIGVRITNRSLDGFMFLIKKVKDDKIKIDINAFINYEINKGCQIKLKKIKDKKVLVIINKRE